MSPREFVSSMIAILTIMAIISALEILVPLFPPTPSRGLFLVVPTWILGVPPVAVVAYRLLSALNALLEHANLRVWPAVDRTLSLGG